MSIVDAIRDFAVKSPGNVSFSKIGEMLNKQGYRTSRGGPFSEDPSRSRGVAALVAEAVKTALSNGDKAGADAIYTKVRRKNGKAAHGWE
jgi:hypothetical protein